MSCVLLHEAGAEPSLRLCRALGNKGIQVRTCTNAFEALGMICRTERETGVTLSILLLVEPDQLGDASELVDLAGVYASKSVCWMYTGSPQEQVREIRANDIEAWRVARDIEPPTPGAETIHEPTLRIVTGSEEAPDEGSDPGMDVRAGGASRTDSLDPGPELRRTDSRDESRADTEPVLTDDELSMLLADEFGEHGSNGGHG